MAITLELIKGMPDDELEKFIGEATEEKKAREERRKQETIARIKELAGTVGVRVAIGGARGRPVKAKAPHSNGNTSAVRKRA
jgi:hypothetical protein